MASSYLIDHNELDQLAGLLAKDFGPGRIIKLSGKMGSGKTTFVKAFGKALNIQQAITSPTFGLIHEYTGGPYPIVHADLYRLGPGQAHTLSEELWPYIEGGHHVVFIEWGEYGQFLDNVWTDALQFDIVDDTTRKITHNEFT